MRARGLCFACEAVHWRQKAGLVRNLLTVMSLVFLFMAAPDEVVAQTQSVPAAPALTTEQQTEFDAARKAFDAQQYSAALAQFQHLHAEVPANPVFPKFGAEAAVNAGDYAAAEMLLQPILASTPNDPQALAISAHSLAQQHDVARRDDLLARMQKMHDAGTLPLASFILEKDKLPGGTSVSIFYNLEPQSRYHIVLMARFYDAAGKQTHRIALESDDIDQVSFARDHSREAAAGVRIFSMDSYSEATGANGTVTQTHGTLCPIPGCFMTGRPPYELFRDTVLGATKNGSTSTTNMTPATKP